MMMKKYGMPAVAGLISLFLLSGIAVAQVPKPDQNSIVTGEDGNVYPYGVWKKLTESGNYAIRATKNQAGEYRYTLRELTAEEKEVFQKKRMDRVASMPKPRPGPFREGEKFSAQNFRDLNGKRIDMKKEPEKVYVLNFWFINCPPCKKEIPELNELRSKYLEKEDVVFIAIALDNQYDLQNFLSAIPFNYHIVDNGRYYSSRFNVKSYPTHVIVGKDGLVKFSSVGYGANTVYWLEKTIEEALGT